MIERPTAMGRSPLCLLSLIVLCACSGSDGPALSDDRTQISSNVQSPGSTTTTPVPSMPAPTTEAQSAVNIQSAVSMCGPADGNWIEAVVVGSEAVAVFAQVSLSGQAYGRSDPVELAAGEETVIGFDPERPPEAFGKVAQVQVIRDGTSSILAEQDVLLQLPEGVSCG